MVLQHNRDLEVSFSGGVQKDRVVVLEEKELARRKAVHRRCQKHSKGGVRASDPASATATVVPAASASPAAVRPSPLPPSTVVTVDSAGSSPAAVGSASASGGLADRARLPLSANVPHRPSSSRVASVRFEPSTSSPVNAAPSPLCLVATPRPAAISAASSLDWSFDLGTCDNWGSPLVMVDLSAPPTDDFTGSCGASAAAEAGGVRSSGGGSATSAATNAVVAAIVRDSSGAVAATGVVGPSPSGTVTLPTLLLV